MTAKKQEKRRPASYFIDYENVRGAGLDGVEALQKGDEVVVLYGSKDSALKLGAVQNVLDSPAKVRFIKVATGKHDALDFQLVALMFMKMKKKRDYYIVSRDTGFDFAIRMAKERGFERVYRRETISGATLEQKKLPSPKRARGTKRLPQPKDAEAATLAAEQAVPEVPAGDAAAESKEQPAKRSRRRGSRRTKRQDAPAAAAQQGTEAQQAQAPQAGDSPKPQAAEAIEPQAPDAVDVEPQATGAPATPVRDGEAAKADLPAAAVPAAEGAADPASAMPGADAASGPAGDPADGALAAHVTEAGADAPSAGEAPAAPAAEKPSTKKPRRRSRRTKRDANAGAPADAYRAQVEDVLAKQLGASPDAKRLDIVLAALDACDTKARFYNYLRGNLGNEQGVAFYREVKGCFDQLKAIERP